MEIHRLVKIQKLVASFLNGEAQLADIANSLDEPLDKIYNLFYANDLIDPYSRIRPWVEYQDIINTITLFYSMKPYHQFMTISFGPVSTDYQRKRRPNQLPTKPARPP